MEFLVVEALRNLDRVTPAFLVEELFAHGETTVRHEALKIFGTLDSKSRTNRVLVEWMKLVP